mmetsp:Transcript_5997/g.5406  ORF Transcript_5997/g.5406 Transcript_5997/m.5406 type:complete len:80 (+) Transcript_5997:1612-1851(+)
MEKNGLMKDFSFNMSNPGGQTVGGFLNIVNPYMDENCYNATQVEQFIGNNENDFINDSLLYRASSHMSNGGALPTAVFP